MAAGVFDPRHRVSVTQPSFDVSGAASRAGPELERSDESLTGVGTCDKYKLRINVYNGEVIAVAVKRPTEAGAGNQSSGTTSDSRTRITVMCGVLLALVALAVGGGSAASAPGAAPAFAVPAVAGGRVVLVQYAGHPRIVAFFATGCLDCRPDLGALERIYRRYRQQGLVVLGIGVAATADEVRGLIAGMGVTFPIGYDERGDLAARPYHVYGVPMSVFVDRSGTVTGVVEGRITDEALARQLPRILPAQAAR
jgi:peroxiredoxin